MYCSCTIHVALQSSSVAQVFRNQQDISSGPRSDAFQTDSFCRAKQEGPISINDISSAHSTSKWYNGLPLPRAPTPPSLPYNIETSYKASYRRRMNTPQPPEVKDSIKLHALIEYKLRTQCLVDAQRLTLKYMKNSRRGARQYAAERDMRALMRSRKYSRPGARQCATERDIRALIRRCTSKVWSNSKLKLILIRKVSHRGYFPIKFSLTLKLDKLFEVHLRTITEL